jgi:hypothetical protein
VRRLHHAAWLRRLGCGISGISSCGGRASATCCSLSADSSGQHQPPVLALKAAASVRSGSGGAVRAILQALQVRLQRLLHQRARLGERVCQHGLLLLLAHESKAHQLQELHHVGCCVHTRCLLLLLC